MKTAAFTLAGLVGLAVAIYAVFPARDHVLITAAIAAERDPAPRWLLTEPTLTDLATYMKTRFGDAPFPIRPDHVVGLQQISVLDRDAVIVRYEIAGEPVTYAVQRTRGIAPDAVERVDRELRAVGWRIGDFTVAAVGRDATRATWLPLLRN